MKNKTLRIVLDVILIIIGIVFLISGVKEAYNLYNSNKIEDNIIFKKSYNYVDEDNIYKYINTKELNNLLKNKRGIALIGYKTDPWMQVLVSPLNKIISTKYDVIYYLELDDLDTDSKEFKELNKKIDISSPLLIIFNKEEIKILTKKDLIDESYQEAPLEYFDEERLKYFEDIIKNKF